MVIISFIVLAIFLATLLITLRRQHIKLIKSYRLMIDKDSAELEATPMPPFTRANTQLKEHQVHDLLTKIEHTMNDLTLISAPDFCLETLSREVGSNVKYVSMVINDNYRKSFKMLLNERRIREAVKLLTCNTPGHDASIATVAEAVGYNSPTSFINAFKKLKGMTPAVYRRLAMDKRSYQAEE